MRILDFNGFSRLYEAEEANLLPQTEAMLYRILGLYLAIYGEMGALTFGKYPDIIRDINNIINSDPLKRAEKLKDAAGNISRAIDDKFIAKGVNTAWLKASDKIIEAYKALIAQYVDDSSVTDAIDTKVKDALEKYIQNITKAKKDADVKIEKAKPYESEEYAESDDINEGLFTSKKGSVRGLMSQSISMKAAFKTSVDNSSGSIKGSIENWLKEIDGIISKLAEMSTLKRKDIKDVTLDEIGNNLGKIQLEYNKKIERETSANTANKEAGILYIEASENGQKALDLTDKVREELSKNTDSPKETESKGSEFKIESDIDPIKTGSSKVNEDVKKLQSMIIDKFSDFEPVASTDLFKKFNKYGDDGKFGKTTEAMVSAIKSGFGLENSSKITQELIDAIAAEDLKKISEADSSYSIDAIYEQFDISKFKDAINRLLGKSNNSGGRKREIKSGGETHKFGKDMSNEDMERIRELVLKGGGSKINDSQIVDKKNGIGGDNAFVRGKYVRFFTDGSFWRNGTKKFGKLDPSSIKSLENRVTDEYGYKVRLKSTMNDYYGKLIRRVHEKLTRIDASTSSSDIRFLTKHIPELTQKEAKSLAMLYKKEEKEGIMETASKEIDNVSGRYPELKEKFDAFVDKHEKSLRKYEDSDYLKKYDSEKKKSR